MLMEPARADPVVSGVGVYATSIRETFATEISSIPTRREVPEDELARLNPPTVIGTLFAGTPLSDTVKGSPLLLNETFIPGTDFRTSATLPVATGPNSSAATTFNELGAKRCVLIAIAAPSISLVVA